ncbi:DUF3824 domain-containing protein [Actinomyces qiguomingii]|uniref:DUF3824 domain-containing protein n=1 Tax=Actinomyces qiguomingii TaxID=2057800 RepID=UPI000CA0561B|nr:DUF3824 domain-containing protein [Actinomyces qiguomingii]
MNSPYPDYPSSPHYPAQQASLPPTQAQPTPGGPYLAYQAPYPVPPGTPQQVPYPPYAQQHYTAAKPRPTAAIAWFMGLFVFAFYPGIGAIITSVIMIAVGLNCRKDPEPVRTNGTAAANWGLNYLLATVLLLGSFLYYMIAILPGRGSDDFLPWGLPVVAWLLISLFHIIISIAFGVRASRGKVVPFRGIPFIK